MTSTPLDLDALEALEKAATEGPWYQTDSPWFATGDGIVAGSPDGNIAAWVADLNFMEARADYEGPFKLADAEDDAKFIVALRNAAPALIAAARRNMPATKQLLNLTSALHVDAEAEVTELRAEIARLREALEAAVYALDYAHGQESDHAVRRRFGDALAKVRTALGRESASPAVKAKGE